MAKCTDPIDGLLDEIESKLKLVLSDLKLVRAGADRSEDRFYLISRNLSDANSKMYEASRLNRLPKPPPPTPAPTPKARDASPRAKASDGQLTLGLPAKRKWE